LGLGHGLAHHGVLQALRGSPINPAHIIAHLIGTQQFGFVAPATLAGCPHGIQSLGAESVPRELHAGQPRRFSGTE
jgi:hypothetical protein